MDTDGVFYLDGTKLTNLVEPVNGEDAATKHYVDKQPLPLNIDITRYRDAINNKLYSMMNINSLCSLSTDFECKGGYKIIFFLLEGASRPNNFNFYTKSVVTKYIQVHYFYFDVWVEEWAFMIDRTAPVSIEFKWQASHDGKSWVEISTSNFTHVATDQPLNPWKWVLTNPAEPKDDQRYKFWRIIGLKGNMTSHPYVNFITMKIN